MPRVVNTPNFTDERGTITDLLTSQVDGVTEIFTQAGSVRGNHIHALTAQWAYQVQGLLEVVWVDEGERCRDVFGPRDLIVEPPGRAHAWKALTDCVTLVFPRGPRNGADYESDTQRLAEPLL